MGGTDEGGAGDDERAGRAAGRGAGRVDPATPAAETSLGAAMRGSGGGSGDGSGRDIGAIDPEGEPMVGLPHSREIGMRLHAARDGVAVLSVPYDAKLVGDPETGVLHGGVVTALLDTACGSAVMASKARLRATATLDLRIDYMRPATAGRAVWARAECYRLTRSIGFARAVAYHDDPADPVASAAGAFVLDRGRQAQEGDREPGWEGGA